MNSSSRMFGFACEQQLDHAPQTVENDIAALVA